jgi:hypothetical protein
MSKLTLEELENIENGILTSSSQISEKKSAVSALDTTEENQADVSEADHDEAIQNGRPKNRPSKKNALIQSINNLFEKTQKPMCYSQRELNKMKVSDLEKLLAQEVEAVAKEKLLQLLPQEEQADAAGDKDKFTRGVGISTLYNINKLVVLSAERLTEQYEDKIGTSLKGWWAEIESDKQQFREILSAIYEQHGEGINQYMSPLTVYLMFMVMSGGSVATKNIEKKKNQ